MKQHNLYYIGRGRNYYVAMEASLKLKFLHPVGKNCGRRTQAQDHCGVKKERLCLALLSDPVLANHTHGNIKVASPWLPGSHYCRKNVAKGSRRPYDRPPLPLAISMVVPTQLVAYFATLRGLDVDKPRNLAKSVAMRPSKKV